MSEKKIVIPKGMLDAASLSTVKNNDFGQEFMSHYKEWPGIETVVKAVLRWQIENWGTAPNSQRMPDIWYAKSKAKWEKFKSQWEYSQIPFVDLLIFFVTIYHESFLVPEPEVLKDGTVEYLNGTTRPVAIWWEGSRWPIATLSTHDETFNIFSSKGIFSVKEALGKNL
jgi:hypothetical protein